MKCLIIVLNRIVKSAKRSGKNKKLPGRTRPGFFGSQATERESEGARKIGRGEKKLTRN